MHCDRTIRKIYSPRCCCDLF